MNKEKEFAEFVKNNLEGINDISESCFHFLMEKIKKEFNERAYFVFVVCASSIFSNIVNYIYQTAGLEKKYVADKMLSIIKSMIDGVPEE